jgi:hypothetical protein
MQWRTCTAHGIKHAYRWRPQLTGAGTHLHYGWGAVVVGTSKHTHRLQIAHTDIKSHTKGLQITQGGTELQFGFRIVWNMGGSTYKIRLNGGSPCYCLKLS